MDCSEIIGIGKDLIIAGATITATVIAVLGLSTWKRQIHGQTEYQLAKNILKLLYQYRDAMYDVRHPLIWSSEYEEPPAEQKKAMTEVQIKLYRDRSVYIKRFQIATDIRKQLYPEIIESEALWGSDLKMKLKVLFDLEKKLALSALRYYENQDPDENINKANRELREKDRDLLFDTQTDDDPFKKEVTAALEQMEEYLKQYLKK